MGAKAIKLGALSIYVEKPVTIFPQMEQAYVKKQLFRCVMVMVMVMVMVFIYRIFYMYIIKCGLHLTTQPMNHEIAQRPDQHTGNSTPYSLR